MRPVVFATLCLALAACEQPQATVSPVTVQWMEWPAEVNAGQPFRTRLVVWTVCALQPQFNAGVSADQSAVTFAPYFLVGHDPIGCVALRSQVVAVGSLDTAGIAPALSALTARTYEMRGSILAFAYAAAVQNLPVGTFGDVVVRPSGADASRRNAAGYASFWRDSLGCVRLRPSGLYAPGAALVLENQADTSSFATAFVRGYIYSAPSAVCGETKVFHLVARN